MMDLSVIILAAGEGTRMRSALPKVMHKVANKPMISHILHNIRPLNPSEVVVVVGPNMPMLEETVRLELGSARCAVQHKRQGTGDAVKIGLEHLHAVGKSDVLVLYGDHPLITSHTMEKMRSVLSSNPKSALTLVSFFATDPAQYGRVITSDNGQLEMVVEYLDCSDKQKEINLCNSGIMLIRGEVIKELIEKIDNNNSKKEYYLTDIISIARNAGWQCQHITIDESEVVGVNSRQDLAAVEKIIQHRLRQHALATGVTLIDPETVYFSADTVIEQDVVVHPHVVFSNGVEVKSGAEIKSFSHIEGATIGRNVKVGPFARIRPGTELEDGAIVGNFVEIKNSKVASKAKVNHLSYIGDTNIGKETNIGAGTITCNYDGVNKHRTEIGDGVLVGSNTALIAPVNVESGVIIAAGSVITKDVESGALAISRSEQKNIPGKADAIRKNKKHKNNLELKM
jgi:bifunctional UDP-N-acetylglucosamine pyrophosphorylase/glucosamine-1-phosphate N-acetyltransferase